MPNPNFDVQVRREPGPSHEHDVWIFEAPVSEERPAHEHIDALWGVLERSADYLGALKAEATVKLWLVCEREDHPSYWEPADFELPPRSLEMFTALDLPLSLSFDCR